MDEPFCSRPLAIEVVLNSSLAMLAQFAVEITV
jgi:hypothetical protein